MLQLLSVDQLPSFMPQWRAIFFLHFLFSSQVWKPETSLIAGIKNLCFFYPNPFSKLFIDQNHSNFWVSERWSHPCWKFWGLVLDPEVLVTLSIPVCPPAAPNPAPVSWTAAPWVGMAGSPPLPAMWTKITLGQNYLMGKKSRTGESKGFFKSVNSRSFF